MLNFETTTLINTLAPEYTSTSKAETGADASKETYGRFYVGTKGDEKFIHIAKDFNFNVKNIIRIAKRHWENPQNFQVEFDMTKFIASVNEDDTETMKDSGLGRLALFINLRRTDPSYADAYARYGKEFFIEFAYKKGQTAAELAASVAKDAKRQGQMVLGERHLSITAADTKVTIAGVEEYQIVNRAEMQVYNPELYGYSCCNDSAFGGYEDADSGIVIKQGHESFGTYRHLIKDVFLPTCAHRDWESPYQDEQPIIGGKYNEYIIVYCAKRDGLGGMSAVGQQVYSETMHTFFILDNGAQDVSNPSYAFDTLLDSIKADVTGTFEVVQSDYDDKAVDKDTLVDSADDAEKIKALQDDAAASKTEGDTMTGNPADTLLKDGIRQPAK